MKELVVAKYGGNTLVGSSGIDEDRIASYVEKLARLKEKYDLIVVTSGAVAVGEALGRELEKESDSLVVNAMRGSADIVHVWQKHFRTHRIMAGQLLATHAEIEAPGEGGALKQSLRTALREGDVPIVNENDALSQRELLKLPQNADNDRYASHIAVTMGAKHLMLFTDVDGLLLPTGEVVAEVQVDQRDLALAWVDESLPSEGRGGMSSKLEANFNAAEAGVHGYIASPAADYEAVLAGKAGTHILPSAA